MTKLIPKMSAYSIATSNKPKSLKRRARFAPQLLADGLSSGIVSDQGNLVHGAFDDGTEVDPYSDIMSDKFVLLQRNLDSPKVDPSASSENTETSE